MKNFIYALSDPDTNEIRYIGKTDNPTRRYKAHLADKSRCHKVYWIQSLIKCGKKPIMIILEEIEKDSNWEDREKYWIEYYKNNNLVNMTDGGDQGPNCKGKHLTKSEQARKNIASALVERNKSDTMREISRKTGKLNKGKKRSEEVVEKMKNRMTGKKIHGEAFKMKLAQRNKEREYDSDKCRDNANKLWGNPEKSAKSRERLISMNKNRIGSKSPRAKLTEEIVIQIRSIHNKSPKEISEMYNVSIDTIKRVLSRKTWNHI